MKATTKKIPFVSVVMITLNGATTIARAIDSILAQDYPADKFEIIVVNDGSTDNTEQIVRQYKQVRYLSHGKNRGISAARNTGLAAALGDIYVSFDCDCIAKPDWLRQLVRGYEFPQVAGVCGRLVDLRPVHGVLQTYISVLGQGVPDGVKRPGNAIHPLLGKIMAYYRYGFRRFDGELGDYSEVSEFYGANCSFPIEILRSVGGWDPEMTWIEDRDLSFRIRQKYPEYHFYAMHQAEIMNDPSTTLKIYLMRPYKRGIANFRFHTHHELTLPLFPSPFAMAVALFAGCVVNPLVIPFVALLLPQLLYSWWLYHAIKQGRLVFLAFPYLQLAEETMVLIGLVRGFLATRRVTRATR